MAEPDDDALQAALQRALEVADAVPAQQVAMAKGLFAWRDVDALLAELTFDSAVDELAGVRGSLPERTVVFAIDDDVELEVVTAATTDGIAEPDRHLLLCHVTPATPGMRLALRHPGGQIEADVDEGGDAAFRDVPQGPVRFTLHRPDAAPVTTPAFPV